MKKIFAVLIVSLGMASISQASWMVEPYLGYEFGKIKDNTQGDISGTNLGVRVAYRLPVLVWFGLDGTYGLTGNYKPDTGSSGDMQRTSLYGVVGVDLPILLRGWVGINVMNELKLKGANDAKLKGGGMKLGVGFTGLPFVSLNLEYINDKFDKLDSTSLSPEAKSDSYMLSVSLPL